MAYLGSHYGHKIRGATELALFRATNDLRRQEAAVTALEEAARSWRMYASLALSQYANPLWTNRVGHVDWRRTMEEVLNDIAIAGGEPTMRSLPIRSGGTILEAEEATIGGSVLVEGASGDRYVGIGTTPDANWIEWAYSAPEAGRYLLDLRYAIENGIYPATLTVNGGDEIPFVLWTTGGDATWASDRIPVDLQSGANAIRFSIGEGTPRIDHLRVEATR
jgi:hypothetical protein